jgi:hypothetical protein
VRADFNLHGICFHEHDGHTLLQLLWNGFLPNGYLQIFTFIQLFMLPLHYVYTLVRSAALAIKPIRSALLYYSDPLLQIDVAKKRQFEAFLDARNRLETAQMDFAGAREKKAAAAADTEAALKATECAKQELDAVKKEHEDAMRVQKEELQRSLILNESSSVEHTQVTKLAELEAAAAIAELESKIKAAEAKIRLHEQALVSACEQEAKADQNLQEMEGRIKSLEHDLMQTKDKLKEAEHMNKGLLQLLHSTLDPRIQFSDVKFETLDSGCLCALGEGSTAKVFKGEYTHGPVAIKVRPMLQTEHQNG